MFQILNAELTVIKLQELVATGRLKPTRVDANLRMTLHVNPTMTPVSLKIP